MQRKQRYLLLLLIFFPGLLSAVEYESLKLKYLSDLLRTKCVFPDSDSIFGCNDFPFPLRAEYTSGKSLKHLGIYLFSEDIRKQLGYPVCNFHERIFLEILLQEDNEKAVKLMAEYKIRIYPDEKNAERRYTSGQLEKLLSFIGKESYEYVLTRDSLIWTSWWKNEQYSFGMDFPANPDLITGMDKKESEDKFHQQLIAFNCEDNYSDLSDSYPDDDYMELKKGIYVKPGRSLFLQKMNADLFFEKDRGGKIKPVYNMQFPEETARNVFQFPFLLPGDVMIDISHKMYGNMEKKIRIPLFVLLCFLVNDHETYTGIETYTGNELNMTVIFRNKFYNCHHLLYVKADPGVFLGEGDKLSAVLYTYIPNHNVKNLYKEFIEGNKVQLNFSEKIQ